MIISISISIHNTKKMEIPWMWWVVVWWVVQSQLLQMSHCQQPYVNNKQLDCYNQYNSTDGYTCNGPLPLSPCLSYLTFRSSPPYYDSPTSIAYLLSSQPSQIAKANNISDVDSIPSDTLVIVPVNCSCSGDYYQNNASYVLKTASETYFSVANNTYQGLTTCQALMSQNPTHDSRNLSVDLDLVVPLRCACPTANQTAVGVRYLLTYLIAWGDSISEIGQTLGVEEQTILDANQLSSDTIIFPFTPILVPLKTPPTLLQTPPPPAPSPESPVIPVVGGTNSSKKWVFVGVGIGAALLILLALSAFLVCCFRRRRSRQPDPISAKKLPQESASDYAALPNNNTTTTTKSWSVSSEGVRYAVESLTVYKFEELQRATGSFSEANRIKGSTYLGSFKGDSAAIKMMKGDVSGEINILKRINHSNIIRLSGFCVHQGNTYLVYEYAENGSLSDWLHPSKQQQQQHQTPPPHLRWKQRVQIAYDMADALNYLHNYTNPPYIHKNLKSSNILLDGNLRAKIANFGLARTLENQDEGGLHLTRHVVGTQGYMAPEYIENGVVTPKLDVFAFGVVVLELLSGREVGASKNGGEELLSAFINQVLEGENVRDKLRGFIDPSLRHDEYPLDLAFSTAELAKNCVAHDLNSRPTMSEVFMTLSKILSSSLDWDPSDELELERSRSLSHPR